MKHVHKWHYVGILIDVKTGYFDYLHFVCDCGKEQRVKREFHHKTSEYGWDTA